MPKFSEHNGGAFLDAVVAASEPIGRRLLVMPVLESPRDRVRRDPGRRPARHPPLLDKYRDHVPAVRVGATDLSGAYGLRRAATSPSGTCGSSPTCSCAVVNVFGRVDAGGYVVTGPVWEYFSATERMFKPHAARVAVRRARGTRAAHQADRRRPRRADPRGRARPRQRPDRQDRDPPDARGRGARAVGRDAPRSTPTRCDVLATDGPRRRGGVELRQQDEREQAAHGVGAAAPCTRARAFGVAREGVSFVDLLGCRACTRDRPVAALGGRRVRRRARPATPRCRSLVGAGAAAQPAPRAPAGVDGARQARAGRPARRARARGRGSARGWRRLGRGAAVVLGFAETATGLGHGVAEALDAPLPALDPPGRADGRVRRGVRGGAQPRHEPPPAARRPGPARRRRAARPRRRRAVHRPHRAEHDRRAARGRAARARTCWRRWSTCAAPPTAPRRPARGASSASASTSSRWRPARCCCPAGFAGRGADAVAAGAGRPTPTAAPAPRSCATSGVWPDDGPRERPARVRAADVTRAARGREGASPTSCAGPRRRAGAGARDRGADVRPAADRRGARRARSRRAGVVDDPLAGARASTSPATRSATPSASPRTTTPAGRPRAALRLQRRRRVHRDIVLVVDDDGRHARAGDGLVEQLRALCERRARRGPARPPPAAGAAARTGVRQLPGRRGGLAADRPVRGRARGADRGARGGRSSPAARTTPSRCRSSTSPTRSTARCSTQALDDSAVADRARGRGGHRARAGRARAASRCWRRWPAPARRSAC